MARSVHFPVRHNLVVVEFLPPQTSYCRLQSVQSLSRPVAIHIVDYTSISDEHRPIHNTHSMIVLNIFGIY